MLDQEVGGDCHLDQGQEDHGHNLTITSLFITPNSSLRQGNQIELNKKNTIFNDKVNISRPTELRFMRKVS